MSPKFTSIPLEQLKDGLEQNKKALNLNLEKLEKTSKRQKSNNPVTRLRSSFERKKLLAEKTILLKDAQKLVASVSQHLPWMPENSINRMREATENALYDIASELGYHHDIDFKGLVLHNLHNKVLDIISYKRMAQDSIESIRADHNGEELDQDRYRYNTILKDIVTMRLATPQTSAQIRTILQSQSSLPHTYDKADIEQILKLMEAVHNDLSDRSKSLYTHLYAQSDIIKQDLEKLVKKFEGASSKRLFFARNKNKIIALSAKNTTVLQYMNAMNMMEINPDSHYQSVAKHHESLKSRDISAKNALAEMQKINEILLKIRQSPVETLTPLRSAPIPAPRVTSEARKAAEALAANISPLKSPSSPAPWQEIDTPRRKQQPQELKRSTGSRFTRQQPIIGSQQSSVKATADTRESVIKPPSFAAPPVPLPKQSLQAAPARIESTQELVRATNKPLIINSKPTPEAVKRAQEAAASTPKRPLSSSSQQAVSATVSDIAVSQPSSVRAAADALKRASSQSSISQTSQTSPSALSVKELTKALESAGFMATASPISPPSSSKKSSPPQQQAVQPDTTVQAVVTTPPPPAAKLQFDSKGIPLPPPPPPPSASASLTASPTTQKSWAKVVPGHAVSAAQSTTQAVPTKMQEQAQALKGGFLSNPLFAAKAAANNKEALARAASAPLPATSQPSLEAAANSLTPPSSPRVRGSAATDALKRASSDTFAQKARDSLKTDPSEQGRSSGR